MTMRIGNSIQNGRFFAGLRREGRSGFSAAPELSDPAMS